MSVWLKKKNRPTFFCEITGMEGEIATDCEETASGIFLGETISYFLNIYDPYIEIMLFTKFCG